MLYIYFWPILHIRIRHYCVLSKHIGDVTPKEYFRTVHYDITCGGGLTLQQQIGTCRRQQKAQSDVRTVNYICKTGVRTLLAHTFLHLR